MRSRMILSRKLLRILAVRVVRSIILRVANDVPQAIHGLKRPRKYHKIEMFPGSSMVEHSAVNRRVASSNLARGAKFHPSGRVFTSLRSNAQGLHPVNVQPVMCLRPYDRQ